MAVLGMLIYLVVLRPRAPRRSDAVRRTTTGSMRPVQVYDTGEIQQTGEKERS
jgi:hypothetical protein